MNDFKELKDIFGILLRRWWLLIIVPMLFALVAFQVSRRQTPIYQAVTSILVGQSIQATSLQYRDIETSQMLALTYADIAHRQPVLQGTVDELNLDMSWQELGKQIKANTVSGTQLLEITVEAKSPLAAQEIADEIARQLILLSPTALEARENSDSQIFAKKQLEGLEERIATGRRRMEALQDAMSSAYSIDELSTLQDEMDTLEQLLTNWEKNYIELLALVDDRQSTNYLTIIEPAQVGNNSVRPRTSLNTLLGAVIGVVLGILAIFVMEFLNDTVRTKSEISQDFGLDILGEIKYLKVNGRKWKLVTLTDAFSASADAFRRVQSRIRNGTHERALHTILVTSAIEGEGKSTMAANLAVASAQAGVSTVIADANFRRPAQHEIFSMSKNEGLIELVRAPELNPDELLRRTEVEKLHLLTNGANANPAELFDLRQMNKAISRLQECTELLIIDGASITSAAETEVILNLVDGVVLVVESGKVQRDDFGQVIRNLQRSQINIIGVLFNQPAPIYKFVNRVLSWMALIRQASIWGRIKRARAMAANEKSVSPLEN